MYFFKSFIILTLKIVKLYRTFGEDVENQGQDGKVDPEACPPEPLGQVLGHRVGLR